MACTSVSGCGCLPAQARLRKLTAACAPAPQSKHHHDGRDQAGSGRQRALEDRQAGHTKQVYGVILWLPRRGLTVSGAGDLAVLPCGAVCWCCRRRAQWRNRRNVVGGVLAWPVAVGLVHRPQACGPGFGRCFRSATAGPVAARGAGKRQPAVSELALDLCDRGGPDVLDRQQLRRRTTSQVTESLDAVAAQAAPGPRTQIEHVDRQRLIGCTDVRSYLVTFQAGVWRGGLTGRWLGHQHGGEVVGEYSDQLAADLRPHTAAAV